MSITKEIQIRYKDAEIFSRKVASKDEAKTLVDLFTLGAMYSGDLTFNYVELNSDSCEELLCEEL